jgi:23S rRNA (cytidine1920-2'-O)/16S rRNA (cytidine1409-2'-O)-methyltransferase
VAAKERLDVLLVERGLAPTREKAQALARAGVVFVGGQRLDKPGTKVSTDAELDVRTDPCPYVSRGGTKLAGALDTFGVDPTGRTAIDVGASTGGFTDCLLQRGAARVVAIDVGTNQLDWRIRSDPRVTVMERTNFRHLLELPARAEVEAARADLAVCDVSFISLTLILPVLSAVLARPADVVTLVKPQFEVGRADVGKGGIVRDPDARRRALERIAAFCSDTLGWTVEATCESPIQGTKGNVEFLLWARLPALGVAASE